MYLRHQGLGVHFDASITIHIDLVSILIGTLCLVRPQLCTRWRAMHLVPKFGVISFMTQHLSPFSLVDH